MKVGFYTACLRDVDLAKVVKWASEARFQTLEIYCRPVEDKALWKGSLLNVRRIKRNKSTAAQVNELFAKHNMEISCLTGCLNNLDADARTRRANNAFVRALIKAANLLGVGCVSTFVGRNARKTLADNIKDYKQVFTPLAKFADDQGVRIAIENCPISGMGFDVLAGNIAYSPAVWEDMFNAVPGLAVGLNYDPSHCYWLGIDYVGVIYEFAEYIHHVHAKDCEIFEDGLAEVGILKPSGWWRYRVPGMGELDWAKVLGALAEIGYDGAVSIEHEDPVWSGSQKKVKEGLLLGRKQLVHYMA